MSILGNILGKLQLALNDPLNLFFVIVIGALVVIGSILAQKNNSAYFRDFLPYCCGILGVFGTFLGIFLGLSDFDSQNISQSIPPLLDGMKLAFFTSLVGMFGSLILKGYYSYCNDRYINGTDDIVQIMKNIENSSVNTNKDVKILIETLNRCFKSDEEYSLISQVRLIRQEMNDNNKRIEKILTEFSEDFSKIASESLVNELTKVVDKFNAMLNDLVSQSFIDLKDSTERLNQWQAEHKEMLQQQHENLSSILIQLSSLNTMYNESIQRLEKISSEMNSIDTSLSSITLSGEQLEKITLELNQQNQTLEESLQVIAQTGEQAKMAIPIISEGFSKISETMKQQADAVQSSCMKQLDTLNETLRSASKRIADTDTEHSQAVKSIIDNFNKHSESVRMASEEQLKNIEHALEVELTKSLESFAGSMVALSQKFVSDYLPLTEKLAKIVHMAEGVR